MIILHSISKTLGEGTLSTLVLDNINWTIPPKSRWVILGQKGSGKSTLLNVIKGATHPTIGWVERHGSICPGSGFLRTWPTLTPRQLVYRVSQLYGVAANDVIAFIVKFGEVGPFMDTAISSLPKHTKQCLNFALIYAIPFDFYLFDGAIGPRKGELFERCRLAFELRSKEAGVIVTTYSPRFAQRLGGMGAILHAGQLRLFDSIGSAIKVFNSLPKPDPIREFAPDADEDDDE